MKTIKIKAASVAVAAAMLCGMFAVSGQVNAAVCTEPTMLASALHGRPIAISGIQIGEDKMKTLWRIATTPPEESTPFLGKVIAEDQDWLSSCQYPGVGIGAGSGMSWEERSVTLWVWADAVDLSVARLSIYRLVGVAVATTSTTVAIATTTLAPIAITTTTLAPTTTTTTIAAPEEVVVTHESRSVPIQYASAQAVSIAAPVAAQTFHTEVVKASAVKKVTSAKSKMKKKAKKKKAVKRSDHGRNLWHTTNN
jgi:hypothetical protein